MKSQSYKIGIKNSSFELLTVKELVEREVIEKPLDGNHGEIHPKGEDFVSLGVPFIMASDINAGRVDYQSCKFITREQADSLRKGFASNGDVLLTHKATIGRTALVNYEENSYIMLTPQVTYYRIKKYELLNNRYLRYYFGSEFFQKTLQLWASSGSTRDYIGITEQQKLPVIIPPIEKQKKIAAILCAYDDLIENNKRRIALLEKMAEEIYREWFVRMRFPGHEKVKFVKGVPEGWEVTRLQNFCDKVTDGTHDTPKPTLEGVYLVTGKNLKNGQVDFESAYKISVNDHINISKRSGLKVWDILFSNIGTLGSLALVTENVNYSVKNIIIFRPKDSHQSLYLYCLLREQSVVELMHMISSGASQQFISLGVARGFQVFNPGSALIKRFGENILPIQKKIQLLEASIAALAKNRALLLTRLISGKLSVEDLNIHFPPSMQEPTTTEQLELDFPHA